MADWHGGCKQPDDHGIIRDCDVFHKGLFELCCMLYSGSRTGCLGFVLVPSCFWQQSETESFGAEVPCKTNLDSKASCLGVVLVPSCFWQQSDTENFNAEVTCTISLGSKASCLGVGYGPTYLFLVASISNEFCIWNGPTLYISAQEQLVLGLSCGQLVSGSKHKPDLEFYSALLVGRPVSRCLPVASSHCCLSATGMRTRRANETSPESPVSHRGLESPCIRGH